MKIKAVCVSHEFDNLKFGKEYDIVPGTLCSTGNGVAVIDENGKVSHHGTSILNLKEVKCGCKKGE